MNVLEQFMVGDVSTDHKMSCLARHIAHWNSYKREQWLVNHWKKNHGETSCEQLREAAARARLELIKARDAQHVADKEAGAKALAALRGNEARR